MPATELLDREEEGHALAARQLHRRRRVVDAVLLRERDAAAAFQLARDAVERVRLARHELRVDELLRHVALLVRDLLLDLPRLGLEAEVDHLHLAADRDRVLALDLVAPVGQARALDLLVRELVAHVARDRVRRDGAAQHGAGGGTAAAASEAIFLATYGL